MRTLKRRFWAHSAALQNDINEVVSTHVEVIRDTLDLIRNENVAEESERDPAFRAHVVEEIAIIQREMTRIQGTI